MLAALLASMEVVVLQNMFSTSLAFLSKIQSAKRRRIRRASGLVHLFARNRTKEFDPKFSSIFRNEAWAHLFMPLFMFFSVVSMLCHIFYSTHLLISEVNFDNYHILLLLFDSFSVF